MTEQEQPKLQRVNISGNIYFCFCVDSPDDGGYYVEMYHKESGNTYHTNVCETETLAWQSMWNNNGFHIVSTGDKP